MEFYSFILDLTRFTIDGIYKREKKKRNIIDKAHLVEKQMWRGVLTDH